jgi:hypothetical protein
VFAALRAAYATETDDNIRYEYMQTANMLEFHLPAVPGRPSWAVYSDVQGQCVFLARQSSAPLCRYGSIACCAAPPSASAPIDVTFTVVADCNGRQRFPQVLHFTAP